MQKFINNWLRPIELAQAATSAALDLPDGSYRLCISNAAGGLLEVVDATVVSGNASIVRGLEGTTAQEWMVGSSIFCSLTAAMLTELADKRAAWGDIAGTLESQLDLQEALNSKATSGQGELAETALQPGDLATALELKVDTQPGYGLSQENYTPDEKAKLAALDGSLWKGEYPTLVALRAAHPTAAPGSSANVDAGVGDPVLRYIWDDNDGVWVAQAGSADPITAAQVKVLYEINADTNAYTDAEKAKLRGIATGATANTNTDSLSEGSSNLYHTAARVRAAVLTGLSLASAAAVSATDNVLSAIGKLQKQISDLTTVVEGKQAALVSGTNIKTVNGQSLLGAGNLTVSAAPAPVTTESTTARTLGVNDAGAYIRFTNAAASTVTVAPQGEAAWAADTEVHIRRAGAGNLTLAAGAGVTLNAPSGGTLVMTDRMSATIKRVAPDVWDLIGHTVPA